MKTDIWIMKSRAITAPELWAGTPHMQVHKHIKDVLLTTLIGDDNVK